MTKRRRAFGWLCAGLLSSVAVEACSSSGPPDSPDGSGAVAGGAGTNTGDGTIVDPPSPGGAGGETAFNPLCGVLERGCLPDEADACPDGRAGAGNASSGGARGGSGGTAGSVGTGGAGGKAGASGKGGASGNGVVSGNGGVGGNGGKAGAASGAGGLGGSASPSSGGNGGGGEGGVPGIGNGGESGISSGEAGATAAPPAGANGDGGETSASAGENGLGGAGAGGEAEQGGAGTGSSGGTVPWPYSCQVTVTSSRDVEAVCAPAGSGKIGDGCFSSADCTAGLGCVGDQSPGQCRPFCCTGEDACVERGTHCAEQRLVGASRRPRVPVCMPATSCDLAEKYPCLEDSCTCKSDTACVVVSADGTTSCVPVTSLPDDGDGEAGDACPCARGHLCSEATDRCVKLCQPAVSDGACGRGRCQASPGLPTGWGVCIGSE